MHALHPSSLLQPVACHQLLFSTVLIDHILGDQVELTRPPLAAIIMLHLPFPGFPLQYPRQIFECMVLGKLG